MQCLPLDLVPEFERRLVRTWASRTWSKRRDAVVLSLCLMGLRWEEVSRVLVCDVGADGTLWVRTAKKGVPRRLPIGGPLCSAMRDVVANAPITAHAKRREHQRVFFTRTGKLLSYTSVRRTCMLWTSKVFGRCYSPHCLRHTFAARVYRATRDVLAVQRALGHVSLRSTAFYLSQSQPVDVAGLPAFACDTMRPVVRLFDPDGRLAGRA